MGILLRILIGTVLAVVGAYMTIRSRKFIELFGTVDYFDQKLGGGGTNLFYKLLGIVMTLIGFLVATNLWNAFMEATLGSIFPH